MQKSFLAISLGLAMSAYPNHFLSFILILAFGKYFTCFFLKFQIRISSINGKKWEDHLFHLKLRYFEKTKKFDIMSFVKNLDTIRVKLRKLERDKLFLTYSLIFSNDTLIVPMYTKSILNYGLQPQIFKRFLDH